MAVDMLEGAFSFVSGEIAKTGPDAMSVKTPAVIGIRGTTLLERQLLKEMKTVLLYCKMQTELDKLL